MPQGFLVIADISGYTSYLSQAELEPAAGHLGTLLDTLIENTRPPLIVSRLEGDAVISYALAGTFLQGQTLVEMIEGTYVAFRRALESLALNNQCDCNACRFVPELDLKFFVHHGTFLLQQLGKGNTELLGRDVNLIHRLAKNRITEQTGLAAYVAFTEQALHHLGFDDIMPEMASVVETYDHIGDVLVFVQDMHDVWLEQQPEQRMEVAEDAALARFDSVIPVSQTILWDTITMPGNRLLLSAGANGRVSRRENERIGAGTVFRCQNGHGEEEYTILSWDPPRQYTYESSRSFGSRGRTTIRLQPQGEQTGLTVLVGKSEGENGRIQPLLHLFDGQLSGRKVKAWLARLENAIPA